MATPAAKKYANLRRIRSVRGPLALFVVALSLVVALLVLWNVVLAVDYQRIRALAVREAAEGGGAFHGTFIALGSVLFIATIVLLAVLGAQLFAEIRYTERQSAFIATFTHELNSPLASIKLATQTLRRTAGLKREEQERFLDVILADAERLRAQILNVLRAAQADSPHGIEVALDPVDLRPYLEEYVASRKVALSGVEGGASLELLPGETAAVALDLHIFRQALDNLVDNALKYSKPGEVRVEIAVIPEGPGRVAIEVRDRGCGIEARDIPLIFERFGRVGASSEARRRPGTGLGLWIVQSIARAHGGAAEARSPGLGLGTTVRIALPALEPEPRAAPQERGGEAPA
jgi:signal transduction histidine kinase